MKYLIYNPLTVVIFSEHLSHKEVNAALENVVNKKPKSAGFCKISADKILIYGESESLKLKPGKDDDEIIRAILEKNYLVDV